MDRLLDFQEKGIFVNPVVETNNLGKAFGATVALKGVNLEIPSHQIIGLVGPNGAGKTTLFSLISGFLKPGAGSVRVLGHSPLSPELQGRVSILPQDAPLRKGVSIRKQFEFFAKLQGLSSEAAAEEAEVALREVDLLEKSGEGPDSLSHGMRKRASLAQTFIGNPELILLDEPTAGLDPVTTQKVRELIQKKAKGRTIVISSHNLAELQEACDSVAILNLGKLVDFRPVSEIIDRSKTMIIRLENAPGDRLTKAIRNLPEVVSLDCGDQGNPRIMITVDGSIDDTEVDLAVLGVFKEQKVRYREIRRGESLEEKVVQITNQDLGDLDLSSKQ
jgi:ABC-2 type transport system ATP-binding protein